MCGPGRRPRSTGSATGSPSSTSSRCRTSSTATSTRRSTWSARWRRRSDWCGSAGSGGWPTPSVRRFFDDERLRRIFSFQSMYAGLAPYEALALYAVITYMDTVNGVFVPGRRDARACRWRSPTPPSTPALTFRYGDARSSASCWPTARRVRSGRAPGRRRGDRRRRGGLQRRPARRLPHAAARHSTPRDGPSWGATRRRRSCGTSACAARSRAARPTTTSTSARRGSRRSATLIERRSAHAATRRCWSPCRPSTSRRWPRPDRHVAVRARAGAEPRRPRRLGRRSGPRLRDSLVERSPRSATRSTVEVEQLVDPLDWEAAGHGAGHAVRASSHRFLQTGPFRPGQRRATVARSRVRRVRHRARRRRADGARVRPAGRRAGRSLAGASGERDRSRSSDSYRASAASLNTPPRHDLLLVDVRPAAREAAPRVGAVRLLPARRRHRRRPRRRLRRRRGGPLSRLRRPLLRRPRRRAGPTTRC